VYWTNSGGTGAVLKVPLEGGALTTVAANTGLAFSMAIDDTSLYWADGTGRIVKMTPK